MCFAGMTLDSEKILIHLNNPATAQMNPAERPSIVKSELEVSILSYRTTAMIQRKVHP